MGYVQILLFIREAEIKIYIMIFCLFVADGFPFG